MNRDADIRKALQTALSGASFTVVWQNGPVDPATAALPFVREIFQPARPEQREIGPNGQRRVPGIYRLDVFTETGVGYGAADTIATEIESLFTTWGTLAYDSQDVTIERVYREQGADEDGVFRVPVYIDWYAYVT